MELRNLSANGEQTNFEILSNGRTFVFVVPNQAVADFLGQVTDCPSFVTENAEIFKEIAAEAIAREPDESEYVIDDQTIMSKFA